MTESIMVMIPLLLTFLSVFQISTGVMSRAVMSNSVQGSVALEALSPNPVSQLTTATSLHSGSGNVTVASTNMDQIPLPGGGNLTIGSRKIHGVAVSPLLPGGDNFEEIGIAVTE